MSRSRPFVLILALVASTLAWFAVGVPTANAAQIQKQLVDQFGRNGTGSPAVRNWEVFDGSISDGANTTTLTVPNGSGTVATLTYTFGNAFNLTANSAEALVFDFAVATTGNPMSDGIWWSATATDAGGATSSSTSNSAREGQEVGVMSLSGNIPGAFIGSANLASVKKIEFFFGAISNAPGIVNTVQLDTLYTRGEGTVTPQTITFTSTAPTGPAFGSTYTPTATGGASGNPVTFTTNSEICTFAAGKVTFAHAGTCTITANQAGNVGYAPAGAVTQTIAVPKAGQSFAFSSPPALRSVGTSFPVNGRGVATGVAMDVAIGNSSPADACSLSAGSVFLSHVGMCELIYSGGGNDDYVGSAGSRRSFDITKGNQLTSFTTPLSNGLVGQVRTVEAKGSGNQLTASNYSVDSTTAPANACTVTPAGVVTYVHVGTCVIKASAPGNADYNAASANTTSAGIAAGAQGTTITQGLTDGAVGNIRTVSAQGALNDVAATWVVGNQTTNSACTVTSTGQVTYQHAGTCHLVASGGVGGDYAAGSPAPTSATVVRAQQSPVWTKVPADGVVGDVQAVTAVGSGNNKPLNFAVANDTGTCTVTPAGQLTFHHVGSCSIVAQGGSDADYLATATSPTTVIITQATQATNLVTGLADGVVGDAGTVVAEGAKTQLAAAWAVGGATTNNACSVTSAGSVSFDHAGQCVLEARGGGNDDYSIGGVITTSATVGKAPQVITITQGLMPGMVGTTQQLAARGAKSGTAATWTIATGGTDGACTVTSAGLVSFEHVATCKVQAAGASSDDYLAAPAVVSSATVSAGDQDYTVTARPEDGPVGSTSPVAAMGTESRVAATLSVDTQQTTNSACSLEEGVVSYDHSGHCVLTVTGGGNADWNEPATPGTISFRVTPASQTVTFTSAVPGSPVYPSTTYSVTASGGASGKPVVIGATTPDVCAVEEGSVRFLKSGTCTISADQAGNDDYTPAVQALQQVTVVTIPSVVTLTSAPAATVYGQPTTPTATVSPVLGTATGSVQFSIDGTSVGDPVAVDGSGQAIGPELANLSVGSHTWTATFIPADEEILSANQSGTGPVAVGQAASTMKVKVSRSTITAELAAVAPGSGTPSGSVEFQLEGRSIGTAALTDGAATLTHKVPTGASRAVSATYAGDENFTGSSDSTTRQDPTIRARVTSAKAKSKAGWYRTPVTVSYTCTATSAALVGSCPAPVRLNANRAAQAVTKTIQAEDGGVATAVVSGINIDRVAPRIKLKGLPRTITGKTPKVRCQATDKVSGIKSCKVRAKRTATKVTWRVTATDKAGNKRTVKRVVKIAATDAFTLSGVPTINGVPQVREGHSYTMVVVSKQRPRYVNAAVAPRPPSGLSTAFVRSGTVNGTPRWVLGVTFKRPMATRGDWNIGVKIGITTKTLRVHVTR